MLGIFPPKRSEIFPSVSLIDSEDSGALSGLQVDSERHSVSVKEKKIQ